MIQVSRELLQDWKLRLTSADPTPLEVVDQINGMLGTPSLPPTVVTCAPIFVSKTQVLKWRNQWMEDHPCEQVTPFDALLHQHVPYDQHTQRLRGACSNIKWSEVPLAKLEAIAAVLCEYGP